MKLLVSIVAALLLVEWSIAQTPIPSRPQGYYLLTAKTEELVVVEVFYDHLCDDSKANWAVLKEVVNVYAMMDYSAVSFIVHIFPLPYHHNAYFMQQAGEVVRTSVDRYSDAFVKFIQSAFDNQDEFLDGTVDMTEPQVKQKIATFTETAMHDKAVTADSVMKGFDDKLIVQKSRYAWKYGCSRGISGTPMFLVNGVFMADGPDYSVKQWENFIQSLVNSNETAAVY